MFVVCVTFSAKPEQAETLAELLVRQAQNSLEREAECHHFDIARDDDGQRFFLYELYTDEAAFAAHLKTGHFLDFDQQAGPLVADKQVQTWTLI